MNDRKALALFDFDGTLCPGDSILPWILWCIRQGLAPRRQLWIAGWAWLKKQLFPRRVSMSNVKARSLSFIAGRTKAELDEAAARFWQERLLPRCYPEGLAMLRKCREDGCTVLIISASPSVYMDQAVRRLGVDAVLSTPCGTDPSGVYTGQVGANVRGDEKPRCLRRWLSENGLPEDTPVICAFGDTAGDAPMLRLAREANAVNPKRKLRTAMPEAAVRHWRSA